jgi:hypothetical protein
MQDGLWLAMSIVGGGWKADSKGVLNNIQVKTKWCRREVCQVEAKTNAAQASRHSFYSFHARSNDGLPTWGMGFLLICLGINWTTKSNHIHQILAKSFRL